MKNILILIKRSDLTFFYFNSSNENKNRFDGLNQNTFIISGDVLERLVDVEKITKKDNGICFKYNYYAKINIMIRQSKDMKIVFNKNYEDSLSELKCNQHKDIKEPILFSDYQNLSKNYQLLLRMKSFLKLGKLMFHF